MDDVSPRLGASGRRAQKEQSKVQEKFVYRDSKVYQKSYETEDVEEDKLDFERACKKVE